MTHSFGSGGKGPTVGAMVVDPRRQLTLGRAVTPPRRLSEAEPLALLEAKGLTHGRTLQVALGPAAHDTALATVTGTIIRAGIARVIA